MNYPFKHGSSFAVSNQAALSGLHYKMKPNLISDDFFSGKVEDHVVPVLLSKQILPLMVLTTDSGCSNISFCIKALKLPKQCKNKKQNLLNYCMKVVVTFGMKSHYYQTKDLADKDRKNRYGGANMTETSSKLSFCVPLLN